MILIVGKEVGVGEGYGKDVFGVRFEFCFVVRVFFWGRVLVIF